MDTYSNKNFFTLLVSTILLMTFSFVATGCEKTNDQESIQNEFRKTMENYLTLVINKDKDFVEYIYYEDGTEGLKELDLNSMEENEEFNYISYEIIKETKLNDDIYSFEFKLNSGFDDSEINTTNYIIKIDNSYKVARNSRIIPDSILNGLVIEDEYGEDILGYEDVISE